MAIYQPGGTPIVNGQATVMNGSNAPQYYTRDGAQVFPNGASMLFFQSQNGRYVAQEWAEGREVLPATSGDATFAGPGSDAVLYLPAQANRHHALFGIAFGYDTTPTSGALSVESPSGYTVFRQSVPTAGPDSFTWFKGIRGSGSADMLVRLANGGANKEVSLLGRRVE